MDELNKPYNPKDHEEKIYKQWEESGYFNPDNLPATSDKRQATYFCITMAPPNVTGSLHMGHALEYTLSDILIRFKRMQGFETLWLPGTDHAGIATQIVVERQVESEGTSRAKLGREAFLKRVWD
ncbi:MAG: class I tRNA ligase family protein, partial [Patescibacteria group bacterium]